MTAQRPAKVLLVDDQPENLVALEAVLRPLDVETVQAGSGEEALRRLLADDFAVILLDVQMPDMDGFETAEFIKQRERTQHIPIIFVTAIDKERRQVFRGYSVGAVDYLFKPYEPEVLRSKVSIFVELHQKNAALRESEERFRAAFANAPIGIGLVSEDGRWIQVNRALCEVLGYAEGELLGMHPWELCNPDDRAGDRLDLERLLTGRTRDYQSEREYLRRDGEGLQLLLSVALARDSEGGPRVVIWQAVDITERRQVEQERAERVREQAARAEAEAVTETIQKIQWVTDAAIEHLALDDLIRELAARVSDVLAVDAATIYLVDEDSDALLVGAAHGFQPSGERVEREGTLAGRVATSGLPASVPPELVRPSLDGAAVALAVPLVGEGRLGGVIEVARRDTGRPFSPEDESLLGVMAGRAALAIDHARSYARELEIVETLQRSLLPERLPQVPGIVTAAKYMPGGRGADVGGDWYDAIALDGGRLGLAMGDVVGHGIGAAALMGQLRNALRAYALDGNEPRSVVAKLDALVQTVEAGRMATLLYMVIEPDLGSVSFASAGHLPPLVLGPDGEATFLEGGRSLPLGVMPSIEYPQATSTIEPGSTLVLYTDGLVEERGASIEDGLEALKRAVSHGPECPEELCEHIVSTLLAHRPATDDIAVLALRTLPLAQDRVHIDLPTTPRSLAMLRRTVARWLEGFGASPELAGDIQVACHEASSNAMEHGYRFREGTIDFNAEYDGERVTITVTDEGGWREPRDSDRGRGLNLIRALMDTVDVTAAETGTTVRMTKAMGAAGQSNGRRRAKAKAGGS